jgi:hypothetical protein
MVRRCPKGHWRSDRQAHRRWSERIIERSCSHMQALIRSTIYEFEVFHIRNVDKRGLNRGSYTPSAVISIMFENNYMRASCVMSRTLY